MNVEKHEGYWEEKEWLKQVLQWVDEESKELKIKRAKLSLEIVELRKEVSSEMDERLILKRQLEQAVTTDQEQIDKISEVPILVELISKRSFMMRKRAFI